MKTDSQLQQDVMAELKWQPAVHAAQIGVEVKDGVVTLAGEVGSYLEKYEAERAALRVHGVKALAIDMEVKLTALGKRTDADIARSAETALEWMTRPAKHNVQVMVENGWVTLLGEVDWQYQRQAAADGIRNLLGVTGVSNQIAIKPRASTDVLRSDIEAALVRCAKADAQKITVQVQGSDVTLSGNVSSWSERNSAREAAWAAPGVRNVVDQMHVTF
jgi:osmotically-inducible protein OsmY